VSLVVDSTAIPHLVVSLLAVGPLVYAAVAKALGPTQSAAGLRRLGVSAPPQAVAVLEMAVASAVLIVSRWETAVALVVTYAAFAVVLDRARRDRVAGDCGCFGRLGGRIDAMAVFRNIGLALGALALAVVRQAGAAQDYEVTSALLALAIMAIASGAIDTLVTLRDAGVADH
jgi:hypothetical protein